MFWFFLILIPVLIGCIPAYKVYFGKAQSLSDAQFGMMVCVVISILLFVITTIFQLVEYSCQISDGEELVKIGNFEEIYTNKSDVLTQQFAGYLADIYPEYEKNIFESISPDGIDLYLVKYPEIKASETIMLLVSEIRMLQGDIYDQQLERAQVVRNMSYREKSPWIVQWFMPYVEIPKI
jgi:uncharacterized protein YsxB (DUF464 family)